MDKKTASQKEAAFARIEKATNQELAELSKHVLGYDPFALDKQKLILPSATRAKVIKIFKEKIQNNKIDFQKND
jgi:hypothetical protein